MIFSDWHQHANTTDMGYGRHILQPCFACSVKFFRQKIWEVREKALSLHRKKRQGTLAERLGNGLQNRVEQFDSARYLKG